MTKSLEVASSLIYKKHMILSAMKYSWINVTYYRIRGTPLKRFASYLSNRKQFAYVNDSNSSFLDTSCGVPQESVLGLLLFPIFINDLVLASSKLTFYLFADDTNIYCESGDLKSTVDKEL